MQKYFYYAICMLLELQNIVTNLSPRLGWHVSQ